MKTINLTLLEEKVFSIYHSLNILHPSQLYQNNLIELVSSKLNIRVHYFDESSESNNLGGIYRVFLNENQTNEEIWQDFAHELGHILRHEGYQLSMADSFREYQEWQADNFAYHFCAPSFLIDQMCLPKHRCEAIGLLARTFNVTTDFASVRLDKWIQRLLVSNKYPEKSIEEFLVHN